MLVLLAGRAAVFIELGSYAHAQKDAEKVIGMDQENTQVKLCQVFVTFKTLYMYIGRRGCFSCYSLAYSL